MEQGIYWCDNCQLIFKAVTNARLRTLPCVHCGQDTQYLTTDVRPVFARERRILQFYGHGPLLTEQVWRSSKAPNYYVNGKSVRLPEGQQLKEDLPAIGDFIADSDHYDSVDKRLLLEYRTVLDANRTHLNALEDEAFNFINRCVKRFPRRMQLVSFSGGKELNSCV